MSVHSFLFFLEIFTSFFDIHLLTTVHSSTAKYTNLSLSHSTPSPFHPQHPSPMFSNTQIIFMHILTLYLTHTFIHSSSPKMQTTYPGHTVDLLDNPVRICIAGYSNSGKSELCSKIIEKYHKKFNTILYCGVRSHPLQKNEIFDPNIPSLVKAEPL